MQAKCSFKRVDWQCSSDMPIYSCLYRQLESRFSFLLFCCSLDWLNQLGCFTPHGPVFGGVVPEEKCTVDGRGGRPCHVLVITLCIICQAFRPNIPQVRILSSSLLNSSSVNVIGDGYMYVEFQVKDFSFIHF